MRLREKSQWIFIMRTVGRDEALSFYKIEIFSLKFSQFVEDFWRSYNEVRKIPTLDIFKLTVTVQIPRYFLRHRRLGALIIRRHRLHPPLSKYSQKVRFWRSICRDCLSLVSSTWWLLRWRHQLNERSRFEQRQCSRPSYRSSIHEIFAQKSARFLQEHQPLPHCWLRSWDSRHWAARQ